MPETVRVRVCEVRQYVRNVATRMPFRYGRATLTRVPVVHLRTTVEGADGTRVEGWSADCLPPGWFDKTPGRTFRVDVKSLRWSLDQAVATYLARPLGSSFELWLAAYHEVRRAGLARGEAGLTCGFGPALVERSVIDAVGKLAGSEFHQTVRRNLLGIRLDALHEELSGTQPGQFLLPRPRETIFARHTIGLADPLTAADLGPTERLDDGLPQTFEEYLAQRGVRYVKIKVSGALEQDLARLQVIAQLLAAARPGGYVVSLDGNENYRSPDEALALFEALEAEPQFATFCRSVEYLEQPLARHLALEPSSVTGLRELTALVPVVIDESDDRLEAFREAIDLGYQGISAKNCKGVSKVIANHCLARWHNQWRPGYFLTGEDLMNTAVLPVQQDLSTAVMLGLSHLERNGHHYVRGLTHLSPREVADCLARHGDLYEPFGESGQITLADGRLHVKSLRVPGYGCAVEPDWEFLTPIADWRYEDLGLDD